MGQGPDALKALGLVVVGMDLEGSGSLVLVFPSKDIKLTCFKPLHGSKLHLQLQPLITNFLQKDCMYTAKCRATWKGMIKT